MASADPNRMNNALNLHGLKVELEQLCCNDYNDEDLPKSPEEGWSMKHIELGQALPSASKVHRATIKKTGYEFVLKQLDRRWTMYPPSSNLRTEREIHLKLKHPNVIRTFASFEDARCVYLMTKYEKGGDLFDAITSPTFTPHLARIYLRDVIRGLKYLHANRIIHRDIKAENIVISEEGSAKIADFGFAVLMPHSQTHLYDRMTAGTIDYLSPEVLNRRPYNESIDIWAIGILAYIMLVKLPPFAPYANQLPSVYEQRQVVKRAILKGQVFHRGNKGVSPVAKDFILRTLKPNPEERMTLEEMLEHPFLKTGDSSPVPISPGHSERSNSGGSGGSGRSSDISSVGNISDGEIGELAVEEE